jgi:hypothetical protein
MKYMETVIYYMLQQQQQAVLNSRRTKFPEELREELYFKL